MAGLALRSGLLAGSIIVTGMVAACGGSAPPPQQPTDPGLGAEPAASSAAPSADARLDEAKQAIAKQDFAKARQLLESMGEQGGAEAAFYLGVALEGVGGGAAAVTKYKAALAKDAKLLEAYVNLSALLLANGDAAGALSTATAGLKVQPKQLDLVTNQALALEATGKFAEAAASWQAAAEQQPDQPKYRLAAAQDLARADRSEDAVKMLEPLAGTQDEELAMAVADTFGKLSKFDRCVAVLDSLIKAKPSAQALVRRGVCKHGLKDDKGAGADYKKAIEVDANYAPAHYYLGMDLAVAKKKDEACKHLKVAASGEGGVGKGAQAQLAKLGCK